LSLDGFDRRFCFTERQLGAGIAFAKPRMKTVKAHRPSSLSQALGSLKQAILAGTTWRYEQLVAAAVQAGASDEQIDLVAHEAIEALFAQAEKPVTPRNLAQLSSAGYFRR
jgi:hypothetical protein